jgi:Chitobiase/beta-hexosaminidase C-terminal domain
MLDIAAKLRAPSGIWADRDPNQIYKSERGRRRRRMNAKFTEGTFFCNAVGILDFAKWTLPRKFSTLLWVLCACLFASAAFGQSGMTPSLSAPPAYNAQPGTVPIGVATGVFDNSGGLLDFAVLEEIPNTSSYQVEVFHGESDGTYCSNCSNTSPNPDVISLGSGITGSAIAVGQFRTSGQLDIAVATNKGVIFLQNEDFGNFVLGSSAISSANGFASLVVGQFNGDNNSDIAAVTPAVDGSMSFTVFFGDGTGAFPTQSAPFSVSSTFDRCAAMMQGNFQSQTTGADLALLCSNSLEAGVLVYLNSGSGAFTFNQTPYTGSALFGVLPGVAVGTLNDQAAIFVSSVSSSFVSYQSNGLTGSQNAFTSVSMIPVGLAPHGPLAILLNPPTGTIDFISGPSVSTYTAYSQTGASLNGTWNSTGIFGQAGQAVAVGWSPNLTHGPAYVLVDAGVDSGNYANFETYVDERSIGVFLVTLNADGTVGTVDTAPVYSGSGGNGYSFPASFTTGDFNANGLTDLAVSSANNATGDAMLSIYLANPDGSLPPTTSTPASVVTVANTDYSGVDAVVAGKFRLPQNGNILPYSDLALFSFGEIAVLTSNGNGTFNVAATYPISSDPNYPGFSYNPSGGHPFAPALTAADVNGDGLEDIVLTLPEDDCAASGSLSQGAVYVLISNGDGTFQTPIFVAPPVVNPVSVTAARFFGTSVKDLVFADGGERCTGNAATTTGTAVGMLQNTSSLESVAFTPSVVLSQSSDAAMPNVTAVTSADLNGNGSPDLVISSTAGIQVLLNQGSGTFVATAQGPVPLYAGDEVPGPLCNPVGNYVGCVAYDSQLATGSFFTLGETDVAASVAGVVYVFQNQNGTGILLTPSQGTVAGPNSYMLSASLANSGGLNDLLVATSLGTAYLVPPGPPAALPVFTPNGGSFPSPQPVTITDATPGATIHYTTNGMTPTASSPVYNGPITVITTETISAIATANYYSQSLVASATFTIATAPLPPQIAKAFGTSSIPLNGITSLTFTITNLNSAAPLSGISFTDGFPAGLTVATPANLTNNSCGGTATGASGTSSVSLSEGSLSAGATCTISLSVVGTTAGTLSNSVTVNSTQTGVGNTSTAALVVQSGLFSPTSGTKGETLNVSFTGSGFVAGITTVQFGPSTSGITVNSVTVTDPGDLVANITISSTAKVGAVNVTVTNGKARSNYGKFDILSPVLIVSPNSAFRGQTLDVTLTGLTFVSGTTSVLFGPSASGITVNSITVPNSSEAIVNITIALDAPLELENVTVSIGPSTYIAAKAFEVEMPTLVVSPNTGTQGQSLDVTLTGLSFVNGMTVRFGPSTSGVVVNSITIPDDTEAIVNITIALNAPQKPLSVAVSNGQSTFTALSAFTIQSAALVLSPATGIGGQTLDVTLTGLTFVSGFTTVQFGSATSGITVNSLTVPNSSEAIANITIASTAPVASEYVLVTIGQLTIRFDHAFTVQPVSLTLSPTSATQGETLDVTISGLPFIAGMTTVQFGSPTSGITVNSLTVTNIGDAIADIFVPLNAVTGLLDVTVVIQGSETITYTKKKCFSVNLPSLTLTPNTGVQGQTINVALSGLPFETGTPTVQFGNSSSGIAVNSLTVTDANDAVANITIASNARPETVGVNITLTGSSTIVLNGVGKFTVVVP